MELRHLKLIETVAEEGTLSKAGIKLHLSQSALSHQLKEIEEELGTLLFRRVNKRLVITDAGDIIRKTSVNIQSEIHNALNLIDRQLNGQQGNLRLSTECYTCYHWLPQVMKEFEKEFRRIEIEILPEFTKRHFEGLLNENLDLVITSQKMNHENLAYENLFQDEQLVIVSKNHPWALRPYVNLEDFAAECLIIYEKPLEDTTFYSNHLKPNGISPTKILEIRLTEAAIQMIKSEYGIKVMAKWAALPYLENQEVVGIKITENGLYRKWYLAYNKQIGWKAHYNYFKKHLKNSLKENFVEMVH
ncbi:MAG: LysR family transcriptional regulator [Reichenbachiella sp.]